MAAGGGHKGIGNGNRGRPYGLMLVLAFGAALLGVMVLHKFRERRIFNLLIKEKDRELMSLQLILQVPPSPPLSLMHACYLVFLLNTAFILPFLGARRIDPPGESAGFDRAIASLDFAYFKPDQGPRFLALKVITSFPFLTQKERERSKEMKRKTEEMKVKIYSLRTQKMELDRRQLEMQSTIDSIKDEQKIMESSLEEKQNEIKMLREMNNDAEKGDLQMADLIESLKQKEAEIENLKHHLENPAKKWSVSTDDPSSPPLNMTVSSNMVNKGNIQVEESKEEEVQLPETANDGNGLDPTRGNGVNSTSTDLETLGDSAIVENASESRVGIADRREVSEEEESQKLEGSRNGSFIGIDKDQEYENENSQGKRASGAVEENNTSNATETIVSRIGRASETADAHNDEKSRDREDHKLENVHHQENFRGGVKSEMVGKSRRGQERYHSASRVRGKRGTVAARNRQLEKRNHGNYFAEKMRNRKFHSDDQGRLIYREEGRTSIDGKTEEITKVVGSSEVKSMEHQNHEDSKNLENKLGEDQTNQQMSEVHETMKRLPVADDAKVLTDRSLDDQLSNIRSNDRKQSLDEDQQQARGTEERQNSSNMNNKENSDEQVKNISKHDRQEQMENSDVELETNASAGDFYKESVSDLDEEKEEYREETDESDF
ncbi:hypothetical protein DKX38_029831 [Salix brachista]|uniref:Uncharacterized protein n=1 Tax=Salix brachista TaxID=2182728 RepID=A0A5N5J5S9_9ROSI|nr:hypothetical protein DKX38_029831 [Salix brachista]